MVKEHHVFMMPNLGLAESRTHAEPAAWLDDPLYRETTPAALVDRVRASYAQRTPAAVAAAQKTYRIMQRNLAKLNAAGAVIGFGADSGAVPDYFHAYNTHRELQLMVEAGMTPVQALTAVTVTSAEFLRLNDHGTLDAGKSRRLPGAGCRPAQRYREHPQDRQGLFARPGAGSRGHAGGVSLVLFHDLDLQRYVQCLGRQAHGTVAGLIAQLAGQGLRTRLGIRGRLEMRHDLEFAGVDR